MFISFSLQDSLLYCDPFVFDVAVAVAGRRVSVATLADDTVVVGVVSAVVVVAKIRGSCSLVFPFACMMILVWLFSMATIVTPKTILQLKY